MNRLLRRQLQKSLGTETVIPPEWQPFLEAVDKAYEQADTDRHLLERSLEISSHELIQTNSQMRAIIDAFPDIFFRLDSRGTILEHKDGSINGLHLPPEEIIGRHLADVLSPESSIDVRNAIQQVEEENRAVSIEYSTVIHGNVQSYESRLLPLPNKEIVVIVRDITLRKKAEAELKQIQLDLEDKVAIRTAELQATNESLEHEILERQRTYAELLQTEAKFRTLVEQLPAVTYLTDVSDIGKWIYVSPQIEVLLGFSAEEWIVDAQLPLKQIHGEDRARVIEEMEQSRKRLSSFECEYRFVSRDGMIVWCRDQAVLLRDERTGKHFFQGVILDVTERVHLEEQLRQSLKMEAIGRLAGGIAHDFNNILTAIMGECYLLSLSGDGEQSVSGHIDRILASANRAAGLTQQLLAYSRRQLMQPKVIDLGAIVANLEPMLRRLIGENIWLFVTPAEAESFIMADPGQIEQAVINLVINSRDAIPSIGKIGIETAIEVIEKDAIVPGTALADARPGEYAVVTVTDTGAGIPPEALSHIFEPFFTTKPQGKGTGLGLSTCYGIVKQSGGFITVESALDRGSTFRMFFPKVKSTATPPLAGSRDFKDISGGEETIFVVEDETPVRSLIVKFLRNLGYNVHHAADGLEALQHLESCPLRNIDLLITDVIMPRMGGKELAEKLSPGRPNMKVLFVSGYTADSIDHRELLGVGAGFLQKPFLPMSLAQKVREILPPIVCK